MTANFHSFKAANQIFEIPTKYSLIRPIGHGAYGVVISALDSETQQKVAIKKISGAFADPVDAKRILREIKLMKRFHHENVRTCVIIIITIARCLIQLPPKSRLWPSPNDSALTSSRLSNHNALPPLTFALFI